MDSPNMPYNMNSRVKNAQYPNGPEILTYTLIQFDFSEINLMMDMRQIHAAFFPSDA